jgi:hypothetical protein
MKFVLAMVLCMITSYSFGLEYNSKIKCVGNHCSKITEYTGLNEQKLKYTDYSINRCYVDLSRQNPVFYKVVDKTPHKMEMIKNIEMNDKTFVYVYERVTVWENDVNRKPYKEFPCNETEAFSNEQQLSSCLKNHGKLFFKVYCTIK